MAIYIVIEAKLNPEKLEGDFSDREEEIRESLTESLADWGFELQASRVIETE